MAYQSAGSQRVVRILAIVGSPRAEQSVSYQVVRLLEAQLRLHQSVDFEAVFLSQQQLSFCDGSLVCVERGEEHCPHYGQIAPLKQAMQDADGVILASPVHSFHISALMKNFFDRLVFVTHRPCFFGKPAVVICTAAGAGHAAALEYMEAMCKHWGFHIVGRLGVHSPTLEHRPYQQRVQQAVEQLAQAFVATLDHPAEPKPRLGDLLNFRIMRTLVQLTRDQSPRDFAYWRDRGWLRQRYYQPATINPWQNAVAAIMEALIRTAIQRKWMRPAR